MVRGGDHRLPRQGRGGVVSLKNLNVGVTSAAAPEPTERNIGGRSDEDLRQRSMDALADEYVDPCGMHALQ